MAYDKNYLIRTLQDLDRRVGSTAMAVIVIRRDDPFDFASLGTCPDCGLPGLPQGQLADWRVAAPGGKGLHGYVFADRVEFHLDAVDACRALGGHLLRDTKLVPGAILGGLGTAFVVAICGGDADEVAKGFGVGALGGGALGLSTAARSTRKFRFRELIASATATRPSWAIG